MQTVSHRITLGDTVSTSGASGRLLALRTDARLDVPVNGCRLELAAIGASAVAVGDPLTVELGPHGGEQPVFTGAVSAVERGIERIGIEAAGSFSRLAAAHANLLYEKSTAGDIVRDLAGRFGLSIGEVEDGLELPSFALGAERSLWDVLHSLARRCGFDFWADVRDRLRFAPYRPAGTHEHTYGVDVLDYRRDTRPPALSGVEVYGESPASHGQGLEAASWLSKKAVLGTAGDASVRLARRSEAAARTVDLAGRMAQAALDTGRRTETGRVTLLGDPAPVLGDAVRFAELPDGDAGGPFKIIGVRHVLDRRGHLTHLDWENAA